MKTKNQQLSPQQLEDANEDWLQMGPGIIMNEYNNNEYNLKIMKIIMNIESNNEYKI